MKDNMLFLGVPDSQSPVYAGEGSVSLDEQATNMEASSGAQGALRFPRHFLMCSSLFLHPPDTSSASFADVTKQGENCADLVYEFCEKLLNIENPKSKIRIERAHRIGVRKPDKFGPSLRNLSSRSTRMS